MSSSRTKNSASSVLNAKLGGPSCGDPYEILGLARSATSSEIQKKIRKLQLTCHPDKRRADADHKILDKLFHDLQEVKDFLLNETKRKKYDAAWQADRDRWTRLDAKRQKHLSAFEASLERASKEKEKKRKRGEASVYRDKYTEDEDHINNLKRANQQRREDFYNQQQHKQKEERETKKSKNKYEKNISSLAYKQVKLKWSRKKLSASFLENDILQYLKSLFPTVQVQNVELLGNKGNSALVTLQNPSDCKIIVNGLLQSDEMRATKVLAEEVDEDMPNLTTNQSKYSNESLKETMLRREAERESLLRRMEIDENNQNRNEIGKSNLDDPSSDFPPRFPTSFENNNIVYNPLQRLEKEECEILKFHLSSEDIKAIQISTQ